MVLTNSITTPADFDRLYGRYGARAMGGAGSLDRAIAKANDPQLTTSAGNYYTRYDGAQLWYNVNVVDMNAFGILRKEPWGSTDKADGFRAVTALPTTKNTFVAEDGNIPDTKRSTKAFVFTTPRDAVYTFDSSLRSTRAGERDQGITWEMDVRDGGVVHMRGLAEHMALGLGTFEATYPDSFFPLDKVISSYGERNTETNDYRNAAIATADVDIYGIDRHTAASWADAVVVSNAATLRPLTMNLIYDLFRQVYIASGRPMFNKQQVLLTGSSTWQRIMLIEEGKQRFNFNSGVTVKTSTYNGLETVPGIDVGFTVSTIMGVPIIISQDIPVQTHGGTGISPLYLIDSEFLMFWVDYPTLYHEAGTRSGNELLRGKLGDIGMYRTGGQTICKFFKSCGKLIDLSAS